MGPESLMDGESLGPKIDTNSTEHDLTKANKLSNTTRGNGEELSKEEKLRRRQERIAAWKVKKSQEQNGSDEKNKEVVQTDKKALVNKRLEEWKRKRLDNINRKNEAPAKTGLQRDTASGNAQGVTFGKLKIGISKSKRTTFKRKASEFDNEEERDNGVKKRFVTPSLDAHDLTYRKNDEGSQRHDELDEFLENMKSEDSVEDRKSTSNGTHGNLEEEETVESEIDEDARQQELLESKLRKLQNNEKILQDIDHDQIVYESFRRNFYKEPLELQHMTEKDVEVQHALDGIDVTGSSCPKPISKWYQLGLSSSLMDIIENKLGFEKPSSIQCQALPAIMSGRDIIGIAKTGSGKTLAFLLPLLRHVQDQSPLKNGEGPIALIMTPTRELSQQIHKELTNFTKKLGITTCCCFGGSSIEPQIAAIKKGVQVLVGTPGRIIDLLAANSGRIMNLRRVTYLVLDEADRMFDMGFEPQVTKVFSRVRPDRQTVLFSATFPRKMELLAKKMLNDPIQIVVGGISVVASEIDQRVELIEVEEEEEANLESEKFRRLLQILHTFLEREVNLKILIFVEKQTAADELLVKLLANKFPCLAIHGGKDQIDRKHAVKEFAQPSSGLNILIATSVAARGLDVKGLSLVINYEAANHMEDYVHRVGRTGRAGRKGTAITFVSSKQERAIADLVKALRLSKVPEANIDPRLISIFDDFISKVKSGTAKYRFGFGGKGLENLEEIRTANKSLAQKVYGEEKNSQQSTVKENFSKESNLDSDLAKALPDFHIIEGRAPETSGPDKSKYHARITINDLPQKARWITVNRDSISKIIESTGTSITSKGQYYAPNVKPSKTDSKKDTEIPPKLYLLVEGLTEKSVHDAIMQLRQRMIEGLEVAAKEDSKMPSGRYKV